MLKLITVALSSLFAVGMAFAQAPTAAKSAAAPASSDCAAKAVGKDGRPLAGAAKTAIVKKCEADAKDGAASGTYTGVVKQQGRVKLDSDYNEADAIRKK